MRELSDTTRFTLVGIMWSVVLFAASYQVPFTYDDISQILANPHVQNGLDWRMLSTDPTRSQRLVQNVTFALNWKISGMATWSYHLFNIAVHLVNSVLFFHVLGLLGVSRIVRWMSCLFFLVHPLQLEAVTYVMGRNELLKMFVTLVALRLYLSPRRRPWVIHGLLALSLLVKETCVLTPLLFLAFDHLVKGHTLRTVNWREHAVYASHALWFLVWTRLLTFGSASDAIGFDLYPFWDYVASNLHYAWFYVVLLVNPAEQSIYHEWIQSPPWHTVALGVLVYSALGAAFYRARTRQPLVAFVIVFFLVSHLPNSTFLQFINPLAENRLYQGNAAIFFLLSCALANIPWRTLVPPLMVLFCLYFAASHLLLLRTWQHSHLVWSYALEKYPQASLPNGVLALYHVKHGHCREAIHHYELSCDSFPFKRHRPNCLGQLADIHLIMGNKDRALEVFERMKRYPTELRDLIFYLNIVSLATKLGLDHEVATWMALAKRYIANFETRYRFMPTPTGVKCE